MAEERITRASAKAFALVNLAAGAASGAAVKTRGLFPTEILIFDRRDDAASSAVTAGRSGTRRERVAGGSVKNHGVHLLSIHSTKLGAPSPSANSVCLPGNDRFYG